MKNHLILGNWNALCDSCGRKFKASDLKKRWDGLIVCEEDWEQRHPQDLLRVQREQISVPWARPYPAQDTYIPEYLWTKPTDALGFAESFSVVFNKNVKDLITDSGALNDFAFNTADFNKTIDNQIHTESFKFSETFLAALARFVDETVTVSETFAKRTGKVFTETISIGESVYFAEQEHNVESLSLAESKLFSVAKQLTETISLAESVRSTVSKPVAEAISLAETYVNTPNKKPSDTLSLAETNRFTMAKAISESASVTEAFSYVLISPPSQYMNGSALNATYLG